MKIVDWVGPKHPMCMNFGCGKIAEVSVNDSLPFCRKCAKKYQKQVEGRKR